MRSGIKPIVDFAFKKIFGTDPNKLSLISRAWYRAIRPVSPTGVARSELREGRVNR